MSSLFLVPPGEGPTVTALGSTIKTKFNEVVTGMGGTAGV